VTTEPRRLSLGRAPPDIAVEVISSSSRDARRDRLDKATEYAAFGVRYHRLVDPDDRTFEVFELDPQGRYARALGAASGAVDVPGCDGLRLDLDALWAQIDTLA
jgi:Uma2 family endonuclease